MKLKETLAAAALLIAAALTIVISAPSNNSKAENTNAVAAAEADVERMVQEDMAAAKREAEALALMREEALNSQMELLNSIGSEATLTEPPDKQAPTLLNAAEEPALAPPSEGSDVPAGYVRTRNGELVNIDEIKNSVRAAAMGEE